jgi:hypothetical protein
VSPAQKEHSTTSYAHLTREAAHSRNRLVIRLRPLTPASKDLTIESVDVRVYTVPTEETAALKEADAQPFRVA